MRVIFFLFFSTLVFGTLAGTPLTLVRDGKPDATIVLAGRPTRAAQLGALELRHVLKQITGAEIPIVRNASEAKGIPLFVGESPETVRRGLKTANYTGEEYEVKCFPDAVVLIGNDSPDCGDVNYKIWQTFPTIDQNLHTTLYAVYDFLEDLCDVRFYLPGDVGTAFTPRKTLTVEGKDFKRKPSMEGMRYQNFIGQWNPGYPFSFREVRLLTLRWKSVNLFGMSNHNTMALWYRYWAPAVKNPALAKLFIEKRPEYFAQGYKGRYGAGLKMSWAYHEDPDLPPQVCTTNPDVIKLLAKMVVNAYRGIENPGATYPKLHRLDGVLFSYPMLFEDNDSLCRCPRCREFSKGGLYFNFIYNLATEVAKEEPNACIGAGAYACPYSDEYRFPENMTLQLMYGVHAWYLPCIYNRHMELYNAYRKKAGSRPVTLWTYMLSPKWEATRIYKYEKFFPGFYPEAIIPIFRKFNADGIRGWFAETYLEVNFLECYLAMNLCNNSKDNSEKRLEEFFPRYFGAAAGPMREYYREVEHAFWNPANYPKEVRERYSGILNLGTHTDRVNWGLGTPERLAKLDKLFKEAQAKADSEIVKKRLELFGKTIHFQMMEGRSLYEKRESIRRSPVSKMAVPMIPDAGGDPEKADLSQGEKMQFNTLFGKTDPMPVSAAIAHDRKYLYLTYSEKNAPAEKMPDDPWSNSVELFFGRTPEMPFHHFVVTPDGKATLYLHSIINGISTFRKTASNARLSSRKNGNDWSFSLAVPFAEIVPDGKLKTADALYMNIMRTRTGGPGLSWSPIFDTAYLNTLYRMGRIHLSGTEPCKPEIKGNFVGRDRILEREWRMLGAHKKYAKETLATDGLTIDGAGKLAYYLSEPLFEAGSGNRLIIEAEASGKGTALAGFLGYCRLPGEPLKEVSFQRVVLGTLGPETKTLRAVLPLRDSSGKRITHGKIFIGTEQDSVMKVRKVGIALDIPEKTVE